MLYTLYYIMCTHVHAPVYITHIVRCVCVCVLSFAWKHEGGTCMLWVAVLPCANNIYILYNIIIMYRSFAGETQWCDSLYLSVLSCSHAQTTIGCP